MLRTLIITIQGVSVRSFAPPSLTLFLTTLFNDDTLFSLLCTEWSRSFTQS